jgi:ketosteroid isomerase-like protein
MSEENVRAFRDAMDAYKRGDKRAWTNLMDPELETVPLPEWPESGPFIGPDAAWDFYKHFDEEMLPAREAYEITDLIDAGDSLIACHEAPMRGRASVAEVGFKLWGVHTLRDGRFNRTQYFSGREEALKTAGLSE